MFDASKCISSQEGHPGTLNLSLLISNCNALESGYHTQYNFQCQV